MKIQNNYPGEYLEVLQSQNQLVIFPSDKKIIAGATLPKFLPNLEVSQTYQTLTSLADANYFFGMSGENTRNIIINPDNTIFQRSVQANKERGIFLEQDAVIISRKKNFEALIVLSGNYPLILLTNSTSDYLAVVRCGPKEVENNILGRTVAILRGHFQTDPKHMRVKAYGSIDTQAEVRSIVYAMRDTLGFVLSNTTTNFYLNKYQTTFFCRFA